MSLKEEFNDNILLTTMPHQTVWGTTVSPELRFNALTENTEIRGSARMNFVKYYGDTGLDTTEQYFQASTAYSMERDVWGLGGAVTRDSTLTGELRETGLVNARVPRDLRSVNPTWKRSMTERLSLQSGYQFADVTYGTTGSLFAYQTHGGTAGLSYQLSEQDLVEGTGSYLHFEAPSAHSRSSDYGVQLGLTHRFSETLRGSLTGGARRTTSVVTAMGATLDDRRTVWAADGSVEKQFETGVVRGRFSREINPSGAGYLVQVDHLSIAVERELTDTMKGFITGEAYWIEALRREVTIPNGSYYRIAPTWRWQWNEWWSLEVSYSYAGRQAGGGAGAAEQNVTSVNLTYSGYKWAVSR
ncbi:MAG TPA: hypothetical protein VE201_07835 [Nitrospirales bacterium]|nr:hypothetical protein [Nitrospirales bacterium]